MKRFIQALYLFLLLLGVTSCSQESLISTETGEFFHVTFTTHLADDTFSRAIGDGTHADLLTVVAYVNGKEEIRRSSFLQNGNGEITLPLFKDRTYTLLFWAQNSKANAYSIDTEGNVTISYPDTIKTFEGMEQLDAFCLVKENIQITQKGINDSVKLKRPLAKLAFGDNTNNEWTQATIQITGIPTVYNPITQKTSNATKDISFSFDKPKESETFQYDNEIYTYLAYCYLFVPDNSLKATLTVKKQETIVSQKENIEISNDKLASNFKTNIAGSFVEIPAWDGKTLSQPQKTDGEWLLINTETELAWLAQNQTTYTKIRLMDNMDMGNHSLSRLQFIENTEFDGNQMTISNLSSTNALLGNIKAITAYDLTLDHIIVTADNGHIGVLVDTLQGNSSFTNISVLNSSASTKKGAAGGMVGYIVRTDEKKRTESLAVTFEKCNVATTTISGTQCEGKLVGLLSGYDNNEILTFKECSSSVTISIPSPYTEGNEGEWLAGNDYTLYNGFLGDETYCRGTVYYGENRFIPKWNGEKQIEPITENGNIQIWSAPDLAYLQGKSIDSVIFCTNVDMNGYGKDNKMNTEDDYNFTPIKSINNLDGKKQNIYNLKVSIVHDGYYGAAFIAGASGTTTHKDLIFDGAYIKNVHDPLLPKGSEGNAYAGTMVSTIEGTYTANNIVVQNGTVYAVNKMGAVFGRIAGGKSTINNCDVINYSILNYNPEYKDVFLEIGDASVWWYTCGEVGGLIGFITGSADIEHCDVQNTTINAEGGDNKNFVLIEIPGRHVNQFIGDIRTVYSGTNITINNCSAKNNTYSNRKDHYKYSVNTGSFWKPTYTTTTWDILGCAYAVTSSPVNDIAGTVTIDGKSVKIHDK